MSKSKCSVRVLNREGAQSFTTRRGARRLIDHKMARKLADGSLMLIEMRTRTEALPEPLNVVPFPARLKLLPPIGFLPYPQPGGFLSKRGIPALPKAA